MKIIHFIIDNKDAILTFLLSLLFRKIEKPRVIKRTKRQIVDILANENPPINAAGIIHRKFNEKK